MINLLPPDLKSAYVYAHKNVQLLRWVIVCTFSLAGLGALSTGGVIYVHQTTQSYAGQIAQEKSTLAAQQQDAVSAQVKDISNSLKLAVQVLSKEVLFSKLLTQLATITPSNTILTDLTITNDESAVDIVADTTDYAAATQLQVNMSDPTNKLFTQADIVNITCGNASDPHYPCSVTIRGLFVASKDNPFLFANDGQKT